MSISDKYGFYANLELVAGIAGVNPEVATICSVTFARYAVQVGLQCRSNMIRTSPAC